MVVWSYGGGTQTAAIAVLILQGRLPRPDVAVIADTGRELSTTWDYLAEVTSPALERIGLPIRVVPHSYATTDMYSKRGDALIPAYTRQNGTLGKLQTWCSNEWKKYPIMRWLREQGHNDVDNWLGISTDELERMKLSGLNWFRHVYPLIEIAPTSRAGCVALVENYGWPTPPKSRCWMCPNQSPAAWRQMQRDQPAEFAQAVRLDAEIRLVDPDIYLHSTGLPLADGVEQSAMQTSMFDGCDGGYCFV